MLAESPPRRSRVVEALVPPQRDEPYRVLRPQEGGCAESCLTKTSRLAPTPAGSCVVVTRHHREPPPGGMAIRAAGAVRGASIATSLRSSRWQHSEVLPMTAERRPDVALRSRLAITDTDRGLNMAKPVTGRCFCGTVRFQFDEQWPRALVGAGIANNSRRAMRPSTRFSEPIASELPSR